MLTIEKGYVMLAISSASVSTTRDLERPLLF